MTGGLLLLGVLVAVPSLLIAEMRHAPETTTRLDSHAAAKLLVHVAKPDYPAVAKVNFIQGSVRLEITVNAKGRVVTAHVVEGEPILAASVIKAVRKWLYRPYLVAGRPSPFRTSVVVSFILHSRAFGNRLPKDPQGDLERQIHPPEIVTRPHSDLPGAEVRIRVLVDSKGKVLDAAPLEGTTTEVELARKSLRRWKFRPAHWGALAVPWYLIVRVPVEQAPASLTDQAANREKH